MEEEEEEEGGGGRRWWWREERGCAVPDAETGDAISNIARTGEDEGTGRSGGWRGSGTYTAGAMGGEVKSKVDVEGKVMDCGRRKTQRTRRRVQCSAALLWLQPYPSATSPTTTTVPSGSDGSV